MENQNVYYIYAILGAMDNYRLCRYATIDMATAKVGDVKMAVADMRMHHPDIHHAYLIEQRPGLRSIAQKSLKFSSPENGVVFKDYLERCGILVG